MYTARYALVEIVNLYDEGIVFKPIHRVVFGDVSELVRDLVKASAPEDGVGVIEIGNKKYWYPQPKRSADAVRKLDAFLAEYAETHDIRVDYVHGEDEVAALAADGVTGILLPEFDKADLFRITADGGVLPRKCFSMGEAREKRYYLEAKRIR